MATNTISIEVNDSSIRVCEPVSFSKTRTMGALVKKSFIESLPSGAVSGGIVKQPEEVAKILRDGLAKNKISAKNAVFSVYSDRIATKEANFPPVNEKKVAQMVLANAGDYFPVDLKDYQVAHYIVGVPKKDDANGGKVRVMMVAAPIALLDGYKAVSDKAGLKLTAIDFAANSRYQVYDSLNIDGVSLYVDVDFDYTYLTFMLGDTMLLQRTLPFGGGEIVTEYCAETSEGINRALSTLTDENKAFEVQSAVGEDSMETVNSRIYTGISRAINVYEGQHADKSLERIILCGVCAKFLGLRDTIANIGITTHLIDEVPVANDYFPSSSAMDYIYMTAAAAILAPIELKPSTHEREERLRKRAEQSKNRDNSLAAGVLVSILFVAIGVALVVTSYLDLRAARKQRDDLNKEIVSLQYAQDKYDVYVLYKDSTMHFINADMTYVTTNNDNLVEFFEKIEENMPSDIRMMSIGATNASVTMNITVSSKEAAARVVNEFRKFELFENIAFNSLNETNVTEFGQEFQFSLLCEYQKEETPEVSSDTTIEKDIEDLSNFSFRQRRYSFEPAPAEQTQEQDSGEVLE